MSLIDCCVCGDGDACVFYNLNTAHAPKSNKPLMSLMATLANFVGMEFIMPKNYFLCQKCFKDVEQYDHFMVYVEKMQIEIMGFCKKFLLQNPCVATEIDKEDFNDIDDSSELISVIDEEEQLLAFDLMELEDKAEADNVQDLAEEADTDERNEIPVDVTNLSQTEIDNNFEAHTPTTFCESNSVSEHLDTKIIPPDKSMYACPDCHRVYSLKRTFRAHLKHGHKSKGYLYSCDICSAAFKRPTYLELHKNVHRGKTEFDCCYCSKRYDRKGNVIKHMEQHWQNRVFKCNECNLEFTQSAKLQNHKMRHKEERTPYLCPQCGKVFKAKRNMQEHIISKHSQPGANTIACIDCGKTFTRPRALKDHMKRMHNDRRTRIKCSMCDETFIDRSNLHRHKRMHELTSSSSNTCDICGKSFRRSGYLKHHIELTHLQKDFKCDECGFKARSEEYLRLHGNTHLGKSETECCYCGKEFTKKGAVIRHMMLFCDQRKDFTSAKHTEDRNIAAPTTD